MVDVGIGGMSRRLAAVAPPTVGASGVALGAVLALLVVVLFATLFATPTLAGAASKGKTDLVVAVGAENEYADVVSQIGGRYVKVTAVMSNPNTDPHTFESSARVSREVSAAQVVVQNGLGYDSFMTKIEAASPSSTREVIDVQHLLGLPGSTPNPHLWYKPTTMPTVAKTIAKDLAHFQPAHAAYFQQNLQVFDASLSSYDEEIAKIAARFPAAKVATTEPVADYLLQAAGIDNMTPWTLQADIMNTIDPSPQDVSAQDALLNGKKVRAFVYNEQVTSSVTASFLSEAHHERIPVVGVYETMPTPGYHYQTWMLAEADALYDALAHGTSSLRL